MFFVARFSRKFGKRADAVSQETMERLAEYPWPGNIRELQNIVERAVVLSQGPVLRLGADLLPTEASRDHQAGDRPAQSERQAGPGGAEPPSSPAPSPPGLVSLEAMERNHIVAALRQSRGVIEGAKGAATILNLHPNTLRSRMKKLGIKRLGHDAS
jgi:formate hydrogenlyase transcriptional activator